jgi:NADPH:quinone reductase-like Zn-dependent oxidoreductase
MAGEEESTTWETLSLVHDRKDHSLSLSHLPAPLPGPSQYLISVYATTFTNGELLWTEPNKLAHPVPGFDLAGKVVEVPKVPATGTTVYPLGTAVYGLTSFSRRGNARNHTVADSSELSQIPNDLTYITAASVPLSALTAWQALFDHAGLKPVEGANPGKRVLVTAASGGVGIWMVQLATWAGAHVTGTCGSGNIDYVMSLGAREVLDYRTVKLSEWVAVNPSKKKFDIVLDCVGGKSIEEAWRVAKAGGVVNSIAKPPDLEKPTQGVEDDVRSFWFVVKPNGPQLDTIGKLIMERKIKPVVDSVWNLEDYRNAWKRVADGHVRGKVVLTI